MTNKIYVPNNTDGNVTVIDGTNNSTTTVAAGIRPRALAVNSVTNNKDQGQACDSAISRNQCYEILGMKCNDRCG